MFNSKDVEMLNEAYASVYSEGYQRNPEKGEEDDDKKYGHVRGEKRPMPPRGHKDREDFEKFYAAQMGGKKKKEVKEEKWIQKAIKKPGALHKQLGVPEGEKIPAGKLASAAEKGGKLGKRARLAQTLKGLKEEEIFDVILSHLLGEGYADTAEGAVAIMANMGEEWKESILSEDPVQDFRDRERAKENAAGTRGPELSHSSKGTPKPGSATVTRQPRSREFSHGGSTSRGREFTNPPS